MLVKRTIHQQEYSSLRTKESTQFPVALWAIQATQIKNNEEKIARITQNLAFALILHKIFYYC